MPCNVIGLPARPEEPGCPNASAGSRSGYCSNTPERSGP